MSRELFGTDGVRGIAGDYPLDTDGSYRIGMAVGAHFAQSGQKIVIGGDTRESTKEIVGNLTRGLNAVGVDVVSVGVITTPGLAYLTREIDEFVAGVMVTASHNPYQYNGIKVFDGNGDKLPDETEAVLNDLIEKGVPERGQGQSSVNLELVKKYEDFLVETAGDLQLNGLKVAVDSANGSSSGIAERVFKRLGADVTPLFYSPDGRNINDHCGATDIKALQQVVLEKHLDLGVALDGDADRLIMVDSLGREVKGDHIMYLLAVAQNQEGVVATIMSNLGFEKALEGKGIKLVRTQVGDRYVLEGLKQSGYKLGGEQSGHLIFPSILATGDGLLAAVQTLKAVSISGKSLAEWCDEVVLLPQAIINIPLSDKQLLEREDVKTFLDEQKTAFAGQGRLIIRPSGTEPLARVMVEANDAENKAREIATKLQEILEN